MKISCDVISDLLPLYAEGMTTEASKALVEGHLKECETCRRRAEELSAPVPVVPEPDDGMDKVRRELWKRRLLTALCAVLVVCGMGIWFLSWLTAPIYLDEKVITNVVDNGDGTVTLYMDAAAGGTKTFLYDLEAYGGREVFSLWTSHWLELKWREPVPRTEDITRTVSDDGVYYFTGRDGEEDVLLYKNPQEVIDGGVMSLPRLFLSYYFQMALLLGVFVLMLAFALRGRRAGKWLAAVGSLLWSYALCQGIVCGFSFASFSALQELKWAVAMSLCLWGAGLCGWAMRKRV